MNLSNRDNQGNPCFLNLSNTLTLCTLSLNTKMENPDIFDYPVIWQAAQFGSYQLNELLSIESLRNSYVGTFESIDDLIADKILEPLYKKLLDAIQVDATARNKISFHVDRHLIPLRGEFFFIEDHRCIHVFCVNS